MSEKEIIKVIVDRIKHCDAEYKLTKHDRYMHKSIELNQLLAIIKRVK